MNKPIIVKIHYEISKRELTPGNRNQWSLTTDGKAGPNVSSGSIFGGSSTYKTREETELALKKHVERERECFRKNNPNRPVRIVLTTTEPPKQLIKDVFG